MTNEELEKRLSILEEKERTRQPHGCYDGYLKTWIEGTSISDFLYYTTRDVYERYVQERDVRYGDDGMTASVLLFNRFVRYTYPGLFTTHISKSGKNAYIWLKSQD